MAVVDETQSKLLELKNLLVGQNASVNEAKSELDKEVRGLQDNLRYPVIANSGSQHFDYSGSLILSLPSSLFCQ